MVVAAVVRLMVRRNRAVRCRRAGRTWKDGKRARAMAVTVATMAAVVVLVEIIVVIEWFSQEINRRNLTIEYEKIGNIYMVKSG